MVGRERDPDIGQADLMAEEVEEIGEFVIEIERHLLPFPANRGRRVAKNIVRRKTDSPEDRWLDRGQDSRRRSIPWRIRIHIRCRTRWRRRVVESCIGTVFALAVAVDAQNCALANPSIRDPNILQDGWS